MSVIKQDMKINLRMEGAVNGHSFVVTGKGNGRPYDGMQILDLQVEGHTPLPFAFDILSAAFQYGNRAFSEYPHEITDYFKKSFPEGFCWERTFTFEDGGTCIATNDIKMEGPEEFIYKIRFDGVNFPDNGPVMQKKTVKWEPSTEIMYMRDGVLKGDVNMSLLLKDKSHYRCDFKTTYKAKNPVSPLPHYHYVDHCIQILSHDKDYMKVKLQEHAKARSGLPPTKEK
uniref:Green fluorescent protein n=1 Tax=Micromussa lordhowensis TaxID=1216036 RepID=A0A2H4WV17_9CNID|nr:green fluorescent protein [Micromussa lordhowensis]